MKINSSFSDKEENGIAQVIDLDQKGFMSVTNDVENVVAFILQKYPNIKKIIYKDSSGQWDELMFNDKGFSGFKSINEKDVKKAIEKVCKDFTNEDYYENLNKF